MQLGFIGLGIMGSRQAANLCRAGYELTVYNRTRSTAEAWAAEHGGHVAGSPREVAARADVVFCMVVDGDQTADMLLAGPHGAVHGARDGALFVNMATIGPDEARSIGAALGERGVALLEAPVTGSAIKAADGTLTFICGGAASDLQRARPALEAMGELIVHAGPLGQGSAIKLINNAVAGVNCLVVAEALTVARRAGTDLRALVEVMQTGSGDSAMLRLKAEPMLASEFPALFKLDHMLKDVRLCLEMAFAAGAPFPAAAAAREAYVAASARGLGEQDFAAVLGAVESLAGIDRDAG